MSEKREVIQSKKNDFATLSFRKDGITEIIFIEEYELDIPEINLLRSDIKELVPDAPLFILVVPGIAGQISPEARSSPMFTENTKAIAVITPLLHQRILGNIYFKVKRKEFENYKLFSKIELAEKWLLDQVANES